MARSVSEGGDEAPKCFVLTEKRVEIHPGRGVRFEAQPLAGLGGRPWHVSRAVFVCVVVLSVLLLGLGLPWLVTLFIGDLTEVYLDVGPAHLAALWVVLGLGALHLLTRRELILVTFESPSIITRRFRFGRWRHHRTPLVLEETRLKTVLTPSSYVRGEVFYSLEIHTGGQTVVLVEEAVFHRRAVWEIADRLAEVLGVPLEDGLEKSKEVLVRSPEPGSPLPVDDGAPATLGLRTWRIFTLLWLGFSAVPLPLLFLIMYHFNPALRPLVVLLGVLCVVSALVAPFVFELRGFQPSLPQVLDLKARTLLVGSMLWPPRPHRLYNLDSPDTYIVVNLSNKRGGEAAGIVVYWHLGRDIYPIPINPQVPSEEILRRAISLNVDAAKTDIIGEAIQLADRVGVDIELVGHETIASYDLYLRGLTTGADG